MRVWITRTEDFANQTVNLFAESGCDVISAPLLKVVSVPYVMPAVKPSYLVISSLNAAQEIIKHPQLTKHPLLVIGNKTELYMRDYGFEAEAVFYNITELLSYALFMPKGSVFMHIRGVHVAFDMAESLKSMGHDYIGMTVYDTVEVDTGSWGDLGAGDVVVFHSARAAEVFKHQIVSGAGGCLGEVYALVMSQNIAKACDSDFFKKILVSSFPNDHGLLAALEQPQDDAEEKKLQNYEKR